MAQVAAPWDGDGFDVFVYGRPEGMTIEHCVLSAAFDRVPTTCRDLCVQKHTNVQLTDPAGYTFAVATDSACRNRLLHSRPVEGAEYLPRLWRAGHPRLPARLQRRRRSASRTSSRATARCSRRSRAGAARTSPRCVQPSAPRSRAGTSRARSERRGGMLRSRVRAIRAARAPRLV